MRVSASMLGTWMGCPLKARFHYIERLPEPTGSKTVFGSCIHAALALYNETGDLPGSEKAFLMYWNDPELLGTKIDYFDRLTSYGGLRARGLEILRAYHESLRWEDRKVLAVEHRFLVPFGNHQLEGVIDLLELRRNHRGKEILRVVDYKSSSRAPTWAELVMNTQFTVYIAGSLQREFWVGDGKEWPAIENGEWLYETLREVPRRAIWYHLMTNAEKDAGSRDETEFGRLHRLIDEIEHAIQQGVFVPRIAEHCGFCGYADDPCPVTVPSPQSTKEEESAWL